jgi:glycosyltransferase involved in cell wall biosynthesis
MHRKVGRDGTNPRRPRPAITTGQCNCVQSKNNEDREASDASHTAIIIDSRRWAQAQPRKSGGSRRVKYRKRIRALSPRSRRFKSRMKIIEPIPSPTASIIVPARNEEASLATCLESLVAQEGVAFEIIVVDDHSTDRTQEIAVSFADRGVRLIEAPELPAGWTGKNNAVTAGAHAAQGEWLLFTDADTTHLPGSLSRAIAEAKDNKADMLSYSPEQIALTFWEMAILPVVFAELARQYPPAKVSDPTSPIAAANGQYILITREAYDAIGGHAAVAEDLLEDVALARAIKRSGRKLRFRYAADAVRTRMYRNFSQLREGWTKNLALLFPQPGRLAATNLLLWGSLWISLVLVKVSAWTRWLDGIDVAWFVFLCTRLRRSNFRTDGLINGVLFGMPMVAYLLLSSRRAHRRGKVGWKGRTYQPTQEETRSESDKQPNTPSFRAQRGI